MVCLISLTRYVNSRQPQVQSEARAGTTSQFEPMDIDELQGMYLSSIINRKEPN